MADNDLPAAVRPIVRQLARRLAIGLFLEIYPPWAAGALLAAGCAAIGGRLFLPAAAPYLPWLWLAPIAAAVPALILCLRRAYRPADVAALADSLSGGQGVLLTLIERPDPAWAETRMLQRVAHLPLPRLQPWKRLAPLPPALAFLLVGILLPQRLPGPDSVALADDIAADLVAAVDTLREQDLITPEEEKRLEEEIARIRTAAAERVDGSAWEAADALRERLAASASAKQDAAAWAQEALGRYAAALAGGIDPSGAAAQTLASELSQALEALADSGLLANAPAELQGLSGSGGLPADPESLRQLAASLAEYLEGFGGDIGDLAALGAGGGRFDPSEFPLEFGSGPDGDGQPGVGGVNRGRADAALTWGEESLPADRFKAEALPPGSVRSPDDWAPVITLPGVPQADAQRSARTAAQTYADEAGAAAWRRSLAPRHLSAVRKYFQP